MIIGARSPLMSENVEPPQTDESPHAAGGRNCRCDSPRFLAETKALLTDKKL